MSTPEDFERQAIQRKEEILNRSPYLRRFLDIDKFKTEADFLKWRDDLRELERPIVKEIESKIGKNWEITVGVLGLYGSRMEIFHPDMSSSIKASLVRSLVLVGYSVGNYKDNILILEDIVMQSVKSGVFNLGISRAAGPEVPITNVINSCEAMLLTGVYLNSFNRIKDLNSPDSVVDPNPSTQHIDPFRKFIEGLDF